QEVQSFLAGSCSAFDFVVEIFPGDRFRQSLGDSRIAGRYTKIDQPGSAANRCLYLSDELTGQGLLERSKGLLNERAAGGRAGGRRRGSGGSGLRLGCLNRFAKPGTSPIID